MKKCRALILLLIVAVMGCVFTSCTTSADEINVTLKITAGEDEVLNEVMKISYKDPTVAMLVSDAAAFYKINVVWNESGDSVQDIGEYVDETDEDGTAHFWEYCINGVFPDTNTGGKSNAQPIKDGDVIEYVYSTYVPTTTAVG